MFKELTILITILIAVPIVAIVIAAGFYIYAGFKEKYNSLKEKYIAITKSTSLRYRDILRINEKYHFHDLESTYSFWIQNKSKAQFIRFNHTKFLEEQIERDTNYFKEIQIKAKENKAWKKYYDIEIVNVSPFMERNTFNIKGISFSQYKKIEEKIVSQIEQRPVIAPNVLIENSYTSPHGRNRYYNKKMFSFYELVKQYDIVCEKMAKRESKESQRKMMTDSLRYDIMKRDGFRCVLCGRNADDGVKLHVDHIIPISKGGKTVPDNLRTLCDSCNFGKSDKYDKYGVN